MCGSSFLTEATGKLTLLRRTLQNDTSISCNAFPGTRILGDQVLAQLVGGADVVPFRLADIVLGMFKTSWSFWALPSPPLRLMMPKWVIHLIFSLFCGIPLESLKVATYPPALNTPLFCRVLCQPLPKPSWFSKYSNCRKEVVLGVGKLACVPH